MTDRPMLRGRFADNTLRWPESPLLEAGGDFALVDEMVLGECVKVFRNRHKTLDEILQHSAAFGDREAFVFPGQRITYAQLNRRVAAVASALQAEYQIQPGDRVGIVGANSPEWIVSFLAIASIGGIAVAFNGWWMPAEIDYAANLTGPKLLLVDRRRLERMTELTLPMPVLLLEEMLPRWEQHPVVDYRVPLREDDPVVILFTSGTTGRPKAALHSHRNLLLISHNTAFVGANAMLNSKVAQASAPMRRYQSCTLCLLPLFHVSGLHGGLLHTLLLGNRSVWSTGRFDPQTVLRLTEEEKITTWNLVPTQLWRVLEHPDFASYSLDSLTFAGGGGAAWAPELTRMLQQQLPAAAANMSFGYGLTESSGVATVNNAPYALLDPESVGVPRPGVEIQIRDAEGKPLGEDCEGEICIRGASILIEYWQDPAATSQALAPGRWLRSGDIGHISGGRVYVDARRTDLIICGAENIYPIEIEHRLLEHPSIVDASVFGVDHRIKGQEVEAAVQVKAGEHLSEQQVRDWVAEKLAHYKVPVRITFYDLPLPRNATGKVLKHVIRDNGGSSFIEE